MILFNCKSVNAKLLEAGTFMMTLGSVLQMQLFKTNWCLQMYSSEFAPTGICISTGAIA